MEKTALSLIDAPASVFENLRQYEIDRQIEVQTTTVPWYAARQCLGDYALFRSGPDVSGVGIHLLDHFFHMNVLRPFSNKELGEIGGKSVFSASAWEEGQRAGNLYAIPWSADVRVVYYRRDLLAQAGIDEAEAFSSIESMQETFAKLRTLKGISPWVMPTARELTALQNMAMWVWGAGGEFMSADGHHPQFTRPEALAGMQQYFSIFGQALSPAARSLSEPDSVQLFRSGKAAAVISGSWVLHPDGEFAPAVIENLGVTTLPFPSFVGGQSLVIWGYSRSEKTAVQLVQHLCQSQTQFDVFKDSGYLPARLEVLKDPAFYANELFADACLQGLASGRGFKAKYMWGLVEDRLTTAVNTIWKMLFANPDLDLEKTVRKEMKTVSITLERMLNP